MTPPRLPPWATPRKCREDGCDVRIILAQVAGTERWLAFEAQDRTPYSTAAVDCFVLVDGQAWKPRDLVEHLRAYRGQTEDQARELAAGHPWHRVHTHNDVPPNNDKEQFA